MVQVWRLQQVAQILTLFLLALNLSLQIYGYIQWRGNFFGTVYSGTLTILLILTAAIWSFAIVWDIRMKMWREQMTVTTERNPYLKEKMAAKEVVLYRLLWLPLVDKLGEGDSSMKVNAKVLRNWLDRAANEDPSLARDVRDLVSYVNEQQ